MADKLKPGATGKLDRDALKRCVADINRHKADASEYNGLAGQATKNAVETYNFDKKALTFVANLARKEPSQQLTTLTNLIVYAEAMHMFDQLDMFNDAVGAMQAVVDRATSDAPPAPGPKLAALSSVN